MINTMSLQAQSDWAWHGQATATGSVSANTVDTAPFLEV
jgi:hypothetical protein